MLRENSCVSSRGNNSTPKVRDRQIHDSPAPLRRCPMPYSSAPTTQVWEENDKNLQVLLLYYDYTTIVRTTAKTLSLSLSPALSLSCSLSLHPQSDPSRTYDGNQCPPSTSHVLSAQAGRIPPRLFLCRPPRLPLATRVATQTAVFGKQTSKPEDRHRAKTRRTRTRVLLPILRYFVIAIGQWYRIVYTRPAGTPCEAPCEAPGPHLHFISTRRSNGSRTPWLHSATTHNSPKRGGGRGAKENPPHSSMYLRPPCYSSSNSKEKESQHHKMATRLINREWTWIAG